MDSSPFETVDCVVIGAGVVGLAVARALALAGREVIVVEAAEGIGTETSSRNSEVIHAGHLLSQGQPDGRNLRRRPTSALCLLRRATACRIGNCGKLIVATNQQESELLASIKGRAEANGRRRHAFPERRRGDGDGAQPAMHRGTAVAATGIVDSHSTCWRCRVTPRATAHARLPQSGAGGPRVANAGIDSSRWRRTDEAALPAGR
jgi:L-2-hydroxyglutarate oxidase LhgO